MMTQVRDLLVSAIEEQKPIILILGHDAWIEPQDEDVLLAKALAKLGSKETQKGWAAILDAASSSPDFSQWLAERFERRVPPLLLESVCELPWSAVFTTALDPALERLLSTRGRQAKIVLTADEHPEITRSRIRPPLYYLFSRAGERDPQALPPTDRLEFTVRQAHHAVPLLKRVLDTATTLGLVVVEGFASGRDWLRIEALLGAVGKSVPKQILWFGGQPKFKSEEDRGLFNAAVKSECILVETKRLGALVAELRALDQIDDPIPLASEDAGVVSVNSKTCFTTPEERLRVEATASIADDSWTAFLPPLGPEAEYNSFRRFHGNLEGSRFQVEGVRRGFAIEREFEKDLQQRIQSALAHPSNVNKPIIVEGQSGTGKSLALARIVAQVREEKTAAVLYATGRIPRADDLDRFCTSMEKQGSGVTLIVCDANRNIDLYDELLAGLQSRGRRIVVVGSQYRADGSEEMKGRHIIEAPNRLRPNERQSLNELLVRYSEFLSHQFEKSDPDILAEENFLAVLYRFLPSSRSHIGAGLGAEARYIERLLQERGSQQREVRPLSQLHEQLIEKGIVDKYHIIFNRKSAEEQENSEGEASRIINLVMVAGWLDCPVPVNLLIRTVSGSRQGTDDLSWIADLFRNLDLFRWESDSEGNAWLVRPRLTLEARILCQRRIGNIDGEIDCLLQLIRCVRSGIGREDEIPFLLNLLRQLGFNAPQRNRYERAYAEIARVLTQLRKNFGVIDPRLIIQESAFRRYAVRNNIDEEESLGLLEEARAAMQDALDAIKNNQLQASDNTKRNCQGEYAALYGFLAVHRAKHQQPISEIWSFYEVAREVVRHAVSIADDYHPQDMGLWIPTFLLDRTKDFTVTQRAELTADIYSMIQQVEPDLLSPTQRERFSRRKMRIGTTLQNAPLVDEAYAELEAQGSTAGYFLKARSFIPDLDQEQGSIVSRDTIVGAKHTTDFLCNHFSKIKHDGRCLALLLESWWIVEIGRRPFRSQRQPLPVSNSRRREALMIVHTLNEAAGDASRYVTRYLEAVLSWLTGEYVIARDIFRKLDHDTDYENRGRVVKRHVISDENGNVQRFEGRIEKSRADALVVRVTGLNETVAIRDHHFPHENIAYGRTIKNFAIAFNFIGPIADPIR